MSERRLVKCWAHRGQRGDYPENSMRAFRAAIEAGADGIESDVHLTKDAIVILLHDASLDRTTTGKGLAKDKSFQDLKEVQLLKKTATAPIPTFEDLIDLLMEPENRHLEFNIDCKPTNDPVLLFARMHQVVSSKPNWQTALAPRLILGLWHYKFIAPAQRFMPYARLTHLGGSPAIARKHFWEHCSGFSLFYSALKTVEGQKLLAECKAAGKLVICWTANDIREFKDCYLWDVDIVITDHTDRFVAFRSSLDMDEKLLHPTDNWLWSQYLLLYHRLEAARDERWQHAMLQSVNLIKHDPSPELSPSLLSDTSSGSGEDGGLITPLVLDPASLPLKVEGDAKPETLHASDIVQL